MDKLYVLQEHLILRGRHSGIHYDIRFLYKTKFKEEVFLSFVYKKRDLIFKLKQRRNFKEIVFRTPDHPKDYLENISRYISQERSKLRVIDLGEYKKIQKRPIYESIKKGDISLKVNSDNFGKFLVSFKMIDNHPLSIWRMEVKFI